MAPGRWILIGVFLCVASLGVGAPALAEDEVPPPPPPPAAPSEASVDALPPAWKSADGTLPPLPAIGTPVSSRTVAAYPRAREAWRCGRWDLTLEGVYTLADQPLGVLGVPVATVAPGPLLPNQFDWDGVDYDGAFGGRAGLAFATTRSSRLELRATYYGNFSGSQVQTGSFGFLPGPGGVGGVSALNTATLEMEADLYSGELNFWNQVSCSGKSRFDVGGGLRVWRFEETAAVSNWATPIVPAGGVPSLSSRARNDFIGVQIGGTWHYDFSPCFEFRAIGKVLVGSVNQTNRVRDANILGGGAHESQVEADEIRLGADVDLGFVWSLSTRIGITFGYNLLILDGVARANEVMDFTASTSGAVQASLQDGQLVSHAFFAGVNFNF